MPQVNGMISQGKSLPEIAEILGIKKNTLQRHMQQERKAQDKDSPLKRKELLIKKFKAQRQIPEPVPPAKHEPAQENAESAPKIIPVIKYNDPYLGMNGATDAARGFTPNVMPIRFELPTEPQRTYTAPLKGSYDETAHGYTPDDRQATWDQYCERTAAELLIQGWAVDVFKHRTLRRVKKMELIGWLLDLGAE
jgi:hypothetical protein